MEEKVLIHHGIQGQHWGRRNGPPYPLGYSAHTAEQKKKNPKGVLDNYGLGKKPKNTNSAMISGGGGGAIEEDEDKEKDELQEEKKTIKEELVNGALNRNPDYEIPKDFGEFKAELVEVGIDPSKYTKEQLKELHDETIAVATSEKLYRELEKDSARVKDYFGKSKEQHMSMEDLSDFKVSVMEFLGEELTDEQYRKAYSKYQEKHSNSYEKQKKRSDKLSNQEKRNSGDLNKEHDDARKKNRKFKSSVNHSEENQNGLVLIHHGIDGQRWGHRNGPPYPLSRQKNKRPKKRNVKEEARMLSDEELKTRTNRLNLEKNYINAVMDPAFDTRGYVVRLLEENAKRAVETGATNLSVGIGKKVANQVLNSIEAELKKAKEK